MNDQNTEPVIGEIETQEDVSVEQEECELCGETDDVTTYEYGIILGLCDQEYHAVCKDCKEENTIQDTDYSPMHPNETVDEFNDHEN